MYWLAIDREPVSLQELKEDVVAVVQPPELAEALESLRRRCLIEKSMGLFTQQPVVMEYMTDRLIKQVCEEINTHQLALFRSHSLLNAQAKDYVRETLIRLIIKPVTDRLIAIFDSKRNIEIQLTQIVKTLQEQSPLRPCYTGGNVLNLLCQLQTDWGGYDFSNLNIWQAYLQGVNLQYVNFAHSDLAKSVFTKSFGSILSVAISPCGKLLTTVDTSGETQLWQVANGKQLLTCKGHTNWVRAVALSPEGSTLASGSDHAVRLCDAKTGQCLKTLHGHTSQVWSVAFSPEGKTLASGSNDGTVKLWDVRDGKCLKTLPSHAGGVQSLAFSPIPLNPPNFGGLRGTLASGSNDGTIKLWDVRDGKCLKTLQEHTSGVQSVAFSPDGQTLASGSNDQTVRLWDVRDGKCLRTLRGYTNWVMSLTFSPEGKTLVSGSNDHIVRLWDITTGECLKILQGHISGVQSVAFSPRGNQGGLGGMLASGSNDGTIKL